MVVTTSGALSRASSSTLLTREFGMVLVSMVMYFVYGTVDFVVLWLKRVILDY